VKRVRPQKTEKVHVLMHLEEMRAEHERTAASFRGIDTIGYREELQRLAAAYRMAHETLSKAWKL
jgi:hypothetical protein